MKPVTDKKWTAQPKFPCPSCGSYDSRVLRGTPLGESGYKRTRRCKQCKTRYVTVERFERIVRAPKAA